MAVYLGKNKVDMIGGQPVVTSGIDTSDATATSSDILFNKTAYVDGEKLTGSMLNNGDVSETFDGINTKSVSIPKGYTDGGTISLTDDIDNEVAEQSDLMSQILTALNDKSSSSGGIDTSDATATASDIAYGKTAYVNGSLVTGNIEDITNTKTYTDGEFYKTTIKNSDTGDYIHYFGVRLQTSNDRIMRSGKYVYYLADASSLGTASPADVAEGKTFTSYTGSTLTGTHVCSGGTDTSDATVTESDLPEGIIAYGANGKITGTLATYQDGDNLFTDDVSYNNVSAKNSETLSTLAIFNNRDFLFREGSGLYVDVPFSEFGTATAEDVLSGKTFTSSSGLRVVGTATSSGGATSGSIVKAYQGTNVTIGSGYSISISYGTGVTISDGVLSLTNSTTLTSVSSVNTLSVLKGNYAKKSTGEIYYIPSDATFTQGGTTYSKTFTVDKCNQMFILA